MKMSLVMLFVICVFACAESYGEAAPRRHLPPVTEAPVRHVKIPIKFISLLGKTSEVDGADMARNWPAAGTAAPRRSGEHSCSHVPHHNLALGGTFSATGVKVNVALKDSAASVGLDTVEDCSQIQSWAPPQDQPKLEVTTNDVNERLVEEMRQQRGTKSSGFSIFGGMFNSIFAEAAEYDPKLDDAVTDDSEDNWVEVEMEGEEDDDDFEDAHTELQCDTIIHNSKVAGKGETRFIPVSCRKVPRRIPHETYTLENLPRKSKTQL